MMFAELTRGLIPLANARRHAVASVSTRNFRHRDDYWIMHVYRGYRGINGVHETRGNAKRARRAFRKTRCPGIPRREPTESPCVTSMTTVVAR